MSLSLPPSDDLSAASKMEVEGGGGYSTMEVGAASLLKILTRQLLGGGIGDLAEA